MSKSNIGAPSARFFSRRARERKEEEEAKQKAEAPNFKKAKKDISYFMKTFMNFAPRKDQLPIIQAINEGNKRILICKGRRWGGTILTAATAITLAAQHPGLEVGIFGPGWQEVEVYFDKLRLLLDKSKLKNSIEESLKMKIIFSNTSQILGRVCSKTAQGKRGRHFDLIIFTEAAYIADDELHVVRLSKLDNPDAIEIGESSPNGLNHFWRAFNDPDFISFQMPTKLNPLVSGRELKKEKSLMTNLQARQELDAEFIDDSSAPFPQVLIDEAVSSSKIEEYWNNCKEPAFYVAGLDLGRKRDRSVMVIMKVLEKNHLQIVHIKEFQYNPDDPRFWSKVINHSEYLSKEFKIQRLLVDCTGLGDKVVIDMKNQYAEHEINTRIEGFNFTYASKNKWEGLVNQLALKFERYQLHFPFHMEFIKQLKSIRFNSKKALYEAIGKSPDIVMATALAVRASPNHPTNFIYSKANRKKTEGINTQRKLGVSYP